MLTEAGGLAVSTDGDAGASPWALVGTPATGRTGAPPNAKAGTLAGVPFDAPVSGANAAATAAASVAAAACWAAASVLTCSLA